MFDFRKDYPRIWPDSLEPIGNDTWKKESFGDWWQRNRGNLSHLPSDLCEQWVYRHFAQTQFSFIPLGTLIVKTISLSLPDLFKEIHRELAYPLAPDYDRKVFENTSFNGKAHPTAQAFIEGGTWDYPIVTVSCPNGIISPRFPNGRNEPTLLLVEGHQRHRYLNALNYFGEAPEGPHKVFVLETPVTH